MGLLKAICPEIERQMEAADVTSRADFRLYEFFTNSLNHSYT